MKIKILRLSLKSLWNSEYTIFVNQIVSIVKKYDIKELHLSKSFERITLKMKVLEKIKAQELSNTISNELQELDNERDTLFNTITNQVTAMGKLSLPSIVPQVSVLNHFLDIHGRDIATANYNSETKRISDFLKDYEAKPEVKTAVDGLNMKLWFDQLNVVNVAFDKQFLQRSSENAATEKVDSRGIRSITDKDLIDFFDAIEFCATEYEELDYASLADDLNDLILYYRTQLKARSTRHHGGKDVGSEPPIV